MSRVNDIIVGENITATWKCSSMVTDKDINKPLTKDVSDTLKLASDGDEVYGFLDTIDPTSEDGVRVVGAQKNGRKWVTMSGTYAVGDLVEAAANTAVDTALANKWGEVSTHTLDTTTTVTLAASMFNKNWVIIFGPGTDGSEALIELV